MFFHLRVALSAITVLLFFEHSHGLSLAPPSLWCGNEQLATEWGVQDACVRYDKASYGKIINITLLYESLCPGCHKLITETLPMVQNYFAGYVNLEFVPFGNARIQNNKIDCQHGPKECTGNAISSCALNYIQNAMSKFKFIECFETNYFVDQSDPNGTIDKCSKVADASGQLSDKIKQCYGSSLGDRLQHMAATRTGAVKPEAHRFVPWILVNEVSLEGGQMFQSSLAQALCQWYNGNKKPDICSMLQLNAQPQDVCAN